MICNVCGTEFEGDFCPACATPAKNTKNKNHNPFYKNPWFWVSLILFICLIINPVKNLLDNKNIISSSSVNNAVSDFLKNSSQSDNSNISSSENTPTSSNESASLVSSSKISEDFESSSEIKLTNNTTVYITPSGKRYHLSANCAGKNATATKLEEARITDKTPCKKCMK